MNAADYRRWYEDISGNLDFAASATSQTLKTVRNTKYSIFVQRVVVWITTDAAQSLTIEDATTGKDVAVVPSNPGANTRYDFDFGARGKPLTQGEDLKATFSAAGLAGHIEWEGYQRLTATDSVS